MKNSTSTPKLTVVEHESKTPAIEVIELPEKISERLITINQSLQQAHKQHWEQINAILNLFIDSKGIDIPKEAKVSFAEDFKSIIIES
jgi:hypothetical protein